MHAAPTFTDAPAHGVGLTPEVAATRSPL